MNKINSFFAVCAMVCICIFGLVFDVTADSEFQLKVSEPISEFDVGKYQYCANDADCVKVVNGCCDCANGGVDVAVNKERYETFRNRFDCVHVECTLMTRVPACGTGLVSCVNHKCRYFESHDVKL